MRKNLRHDIETAGLALALVGALLYSLAGIIPEDQPAGPVFVEVKPDDG